MWLLLCWRPSLSLSSLITWPTPLRGLYTLHSFDVNLVYNVIAMDFKALAAECRDATFRYAFQMSHYVLQWSSSTVRLTSSSFHPILTNGNIDFAVYGCVFHLQRDPHCFVLVDASRWDDWHLYEPATNWHTICRIWTKGWAWRTRDRHHWRRRWAWLHFCSGSQESDSRVATWRLVAASACSGWC